FQIVSRQVAHPLLRDINEKIKRDLRDGQSLSMSLQNQSRFFSPLFINLVKAGEVSGTLEASFARIADFFERKNTLKNSLLKSIAYPTFLLFVGLLTIAVLFIFILPKLIPVFKDMDVHIPWMTRVLLNTADAIRRYWKFIVIFLGVAFLAVRHFLKTPDGKIFFQKILLKTPYIHTIVLKKDLSESFYSLGTLIQNGVPPAQALAITKDSTENIALGRSFETMLADFKKGKNISDLMEGSSFFFPEAVNMIRVGEKTGNLEKPLLKLSQNYERDVQRVLETFITIVEPAMILLFGASIGFIAIAILLPIFQLNFSVT
ncbi:MAG: type II secretion system F family protein, partial [Candidatus Aureabacteria bacterium]|nr:type II secretion system F family protein [Candidatus Auribacterota bacterium]